MYWELSRARTLSIHWPSSYFSGVLGVLKVSQRCKTAQLSSSAHSDRIQRDADTAFSRELSCVKLCCWVLFSYISGLLEHRAIIQSFLMRWWHSFRLGWRPQTGQWLSAISLSTRAVAQQPVALPGFGRKLVGHKSLINYSWGRGQSISLVKQWTRVCWAAVFSTFRWANVF